jgi:hypothetical protein
MLEQVLKISSYKKQLRYYFEVSLPCPFQITRGKCQLPNTRIDEIALQENHQQNVDGKETYCSSANERYETNYIIFNLYK